MFLPHDDGEVNIAGSFLAPEEAAIAYDPDDVQRQIRRAAPLAEGHKTIE
jgi:hypothetical protein